MWKRIVENWVYGGSVSAVVWLFFGLVAFRDAPLALILLFLHLPIYQVHQLEEHDQDRFRLYMNRVMGRGFEVLTKEAVFFINVIGVWVLFAVLIVAGATAGVGWGLGAVYGTLVNAVLHIIPALRKKEINPGLITAVFLFLPLSVVTLILIIRTPGVGVAAQVLGLAIGIGLHAAIMMYAVCRYRRLSRVGGERTV